MAEAVQAATPSPPPTVPQKRPLNVEDKHAPAVASPLNPQGTRLREERAKKPTAKVRKDSPEPTSAGKKGSKKISKDPEYVRPTRYLNAPPKIIDFEPPALPILAHVSTRKERLFHEASEIVTNKKGYRFTHAIADPRFTASQHMRYTEYEPFRARLSYEDSSAQILFDSQDAVTTEKGFRMARANVSAREGRWYWECKIVSGISPHGDAESRAGDGGHVRIGIARREASLDGPVGFDAYSYGLRDVSGQKVTRSRPGDFAQADLCEGDVVGLELTLPSLPLHRKVVEGVYNKAVDTSDDLDPAA